MVRDATPEEQAEFARKGEVFVTFIPKSKKKKEDQEKQDKEQEEEKE